MKAWPIAPGLWRTRVDIGLWRHGWVWPVILATGLLLAAAHWLWIPQQQAALRTSQFEVNTAKQRLQIVRNIPVIATPTIVTVDPKESLNGYTISEAELSNIVRQITEIAKTQGLVLTQSEFQTSNEGHGGLRQVQITLPVRANYAQVRSFAEAALRQLPMVSVDQIGIKRETIAQTSVEVRLKLSVWVDPRKGSSSASAKLAPTAAGMQLP